MMLPSWSQISPSALYQQAIIDWQQGRTLSAIALWKEFVEKVNNNDIKSRGYLNLAQAYLELGHFHKAREAWERGKDLAPPELSSLITGIEGNIALAEKDFEQAIAAYTRIPESLLSLSNLSIAYEGRAIERDQLAKEANWEGDWQQQQQGEARAKEDWQQAIAAARRAINLAGKEISLDAARSWVRWGQLGQPGGWAKAIDVLQQLPDTKAKGALLLEVARHDPLVLPLAESVASSLDNSSLLAQVALLSSKSALEQGNYNKALEWSRRAYGFSQSNLELLYQVQWNLGQIYHKLKQHDTARKYYQQAVATTEKVRKEVASGTRAVQLSFQEFLNPLYREFLNFLLSNPTQDDLQQAISVLKQLQLAELESYFADPCQITISEKEPENLSEATIFTIIFPKALHEIVRLPSGQFLHQSINVAQGELELLLREWRSQLEDEFSFEFRSTASQLYDWLIRPWAKELQEIKTLVFVNDGIFRSVPMSALWDGDRCYLVESHEIAYSLGLGTTLKEPFRGINLAIFASSQGTQRFPQPLPYIETEVEQILQLVGGNAYLNQDFTAEQFSEALSSPEHTALHLASHARFASFEGSYIQSGTGVLSLEQLERQLRSKKAPLQLLVLSACQTASGNNRAILGLAGVGIRANIPSVLGSLWFADDRSSAELMISFYQHWQQRHEIVQSLQQAQLNLIKSPLEHPRYWAPYILVKN